MATIGIKVDANFTEASNEIKKFAGTSAAETKRITSNLKKIEKFQADKFIQKNKRIALSVRATRGATAALSTENRGLERKIQMLIRNGVDPMDDKLKLLRQEYSRTNKEMKKTQKWSGKISAGMKTAAFAVTGFAFALAMTVRAAIEQNQAEAQLNAVLASTKHVAGLTAKELKKMASSLQLVSTFGDEAIIKSQALLLTFTKIGKDIFPAAQQAILNVSTAMGQDLRTTTIQLGKALNDPVANLGALSRTGIQFSDVQKKLIKNFAKTGQVAKAQAIILKELNTQFGGAALAKAQTFGGQLTILKNIFGDIKENIGKLIIKALAPFVRIFTQILDVFKKLPGPVQQVIITVGLLIGTWLVLTKVVAAFGVTMNFALWQVTLIIAALALIITAISNWEKFKKFIAAFWIFFKAAAEVAVAAVICAAVEIPTLMAKIMSKVMKITSRPLVGLLKLTSKLDFTGVTGKAIKGIEALVRAPVDGINALTSTAKTKADKYLKSAVSNVKTSWGVMSNVIKDVSTDIIGNQNKIIEKNKKIGAGPKVNNTLLGQYATMLEGFRTEQQLNDEMMKIANQENFDADIEILTEQLGQKKALQMLETAAKLKQAGQEGKALKLINAATNKAIEKQDKKSFQRILSGTNQFFSDLAAVAKAGGAKSFRAYQALAVAQATIAGIQAAVNAWNAGMQIGGPLGPIFAAAFMGASIATTGVQIAAITKQKPPSMETGGNFVVPDNPRSSRVDSRSVRVNPGETVAVTPRGEGAGSIIVNNYLDKSLLYSVVQEGINDGEITITNENIVSFA